MSDENKNKPAVGNEEEIYGEATYYAEALIKEVMATTDDKVSFTLEPVAPYIFEKKKGDGSTERCLLFVDDAKNSDMAKIVKTNQSFGAPEPVDFHSLIVAKANRLRVRLLVVIDESAKENFKTESRTDEAKKRPFTVNRLEVL